MFSGRSIPSFGTKTFKPAKHKVIGAGSQNSAERILSIIVRGTISNNASSISRFVYSDYWLLSQSILLPGCYLPTGGIITSSQVILTLYQAICFWVTGNIVGCINRALSFDYEMSSLIRSSVIWNNWLWRWHSRIRNVRAGRNITNMEKNHNSHLEWVFCPVRTKQ